MGKQRGCGSWSSSSIVIIEAELRRRIGASPQAGLPRVDPPTFAFPRPAHLNGETQHHGNIAMFFFETRFCRPSQRDDVPRR